MFHQFQIHRHFLLRIYPHRQRYLTIHQNQSMLRIVFDSSCTDKLLFPIESVIPSQIISFLIWFIHLYFFAFPIPYLLNLKIRNQQHIALFLVIQVPHMKL